MKNMVVPTDYVEKTEKEHKTHIMSIISPGMISERVEFIRATAIGLSNQGYRVLIIDLDFETALFANLLENIESIDTSSIIYSNDWYSAEEKIPIEDILGQLALINTNAMFPISIMPCSQDMKKLREIQDLDKNFLNKKVPRRMSRFFKELRKEEYFDIVFLNLPYLNQHTINGMMSSNYNFLLVDHDRFSFNLVRKSIDALVGIYPMLNIAGLLLHRFQYAPVPENDAFLKAVIEEEFRLPVVARFPSIKDNLLELSDEIYESGEIWSLNDPDIREFFEKIALDIISFAATPRRIALKKKLQLLQLYVIHESGIPVYTHTFEGAKTDEGEKILAGAGLTSIIAGTEIFMAEITKQSNSTAKLIEMQDVKLVIEQYKNIKALLLMNVYDEQTRKNLKAFIRHFGKRYEENLSQFVGEVTVFSSAEDLVKEVLLMEEVDQKEELQIPLYLIRGIGKSRSWILQQNGISSINELVKHDGLQSIADTLQIQVKHVEKWVEQGKRILESELIN